MFPGPKEGAVQFPVARQDGLVVRELPDETLVYDLRANKAHCLNRAAALVWRLCDGRTGLAELAAALREELGVPDGEAAARLALRQLSRRGLLERPAVEDGSDRMGRREALRKLAVLGALPLVMTVAAPHASSAFSTQLCQDNPCKLQGVRLTAGGPCFQTNNEDKGVPCSGGRCDGQGNCVPESQGAVTNCAGVADGTACSVVQSSTGKTLTGVCKNGGCSTT
jgi:hypothetical protein